MGFKIPVEGLCRVLERLEKFSYLGIAFLVLIVFGAIATARYGDPAAQAILDRERAVTAAIQALVADKKEEIRSDKMLAEQLNELRKDVQELKRGKP